VKQRKPFDPGTLWRLLRRLGPHARPHRKKLFIGFLAMSIAAVAEVIRPWPVKVIFDGLLIPQTSPDAIMAWAVGLFGQGNVLLTVACLTIILIALLGGVAGYVQSTMIASVGQNVVADIRLELYRHVQRLSHSFHDSVSTADIISRLTGDVRLMRDLLVEAGVLFAARLMVLVGTVAVMALMDWRLTLAAMLVLPGLVWLTRRYGGKIKDAARLQRRREGRIAVVMTEGISAISLVKGFANEAYEEARFTEQNTSSAEAGVVSTRVSAEMDRMVQFVLAVGTCAVMWYGVIRVRDGAISPGDLLVFTAYLTTLYKPIRRMSSMSARVAKATASGERLLEVLDLQPEIADRADAKAAPYLRRFISFDNVSFAYPGGNPVLENASLTIRAGETVALVGPSGMGKSSAAKLLMRFYDPQAGRILLDGRNLQEFRLDSLRDQISVVLQDSQLFATTIRDNIAYGRLDATDDQILAAATAAGADRFIRRLPLGYDTVMGERGETLSGGQRQRIAIARALLRDAPILILDEPLTGLDRTTAEELVRTLKMVTRGRTTLLIAHDPISLQLADRVVRLKDRKFLDDDFPPLILERKA
jgi:ABC-type multidrug transport system fused ATPase/permease subunit